MKRLLVVAVACVTLFSCGKKEERTYMVTGDVQPILGEWEGAILINEMELGMTVEFFTEGDSLKATMDIPMQGANDLALINIQYDGSVVYFELEATIGTARYDGKLVEGKIEGDFKQGMAKGTFYLARPVEEEVPYYKEEVSVKVSDDITLAGTLSMPDQIGTYPAVILITGSGMQDRDENVLGFKVFKVIADSLTRNGIAVLRCDDRGTAESTGQGGWDENTSEDFAEDALAQIEFLKTRKNIDKDRIGLLGHSEGGIIASLVVPQTDDVEFIIMMAGPGVRGDSIIMAQLELIMRAEKAKEKEIARQLDIQKRTFTYLETGEGYDQLRADMREDMVKSLRQLTPAQRKAMGDKDEYVDKQLDLKLQSVESAWFRFFASYDPAPNLAQADCRILALYGEKDLQVPAGMNRKGLGHAFAQAGKENFKIRVFENANHLFQHAETGSPNEYARLPKEFVPGYIEEIKDWILSVE